MDDASERLAPVSYLPWATPGVTPAGGSDQPDSSDDEKIDPGDQGELGADPVDDTGAAVAAARPIRSDRASGGRVGRDDRAARSGQVSSEFGGSRRSGSGGSRRRFGGSADVGPEAVDDRDAETGPQRDDRIDRLVVSRLRRSALSVAEVRSVLAEHGLHEIEIEEWIERYERLGYLDDARLAEQLVHVNSERRGRGSGAILQELTRRGIDADEARSAIADLDPDTEFDNARTTAERRARQLRGLDRTTAERRLSAFLQRRGYRGDVVRQVVTEVLAADGS
ncbi:regulatory protein RecX [Agromyces sp. PvR057]|uniref:regulatory protein RecX n=1 Tax=Agromyces sp. PvR057 TaxID=3156403 RepID=UPI000E23B283